MLTRRVLRPVGVCSEGAAPIIEQLCAALEPFDSIMTERVAEATKEDLVLTPRGLVDVEARKASFLFTPLPRDDRLTRAIGNDNIIAITSARYSPQPLVIQGPGAGADITAAGLFADLLGLSRTLVEWTIPKMDSTLG